MPGKPDESPLIEAIGYSDTTKMPPKSKLPDSEIASLTKWVEMGAPWPVEAEKAVASPAKSKVFNLKERAKHWSFQPIRRVEPPDLVGNAWPRNPIDRFLLAAMEAKGLKPAPEADRPHPDPPPYFRPHRLAPHSVGNRCFSERRIPSGL